MQNVIITKLDVSPWIVIIHVFSCRVYGLRKYKKAIENEKNM